MLLQVHEVLAGHGGRQTQPPGSPHKLPDSTICRKTFMLSRVSMADIVYSSERFPPRRVVCSSMRAYPRTSEPNNSRFVDAVFPQENLAFLIPPTRSG